MEFYTYRIVDERGDSTPNPTVPEQIGEPNMDNPMQPKMKGGGIVKLIIGANIEILPSGRSKKIWFNFTANC